MLTMATFDRSTPFMLLARIHVKADCLDQYLELARITDVAVQSSEPGMLHHTFDQDPEDPQAFVWSEVYANDEAFAVHVSNPPVQEYLQKHAELGDGFSIEVYGTVGDDCRKLMESFGLPLKIYESKLGYSRV
jgi:(4S)-4-hydroxy-5-phosphonooxypentane-2,3-dione isomerase